MMGITHATSGAAAWIAIASTLPIVSSGAYPLDPVGVLAGTAVCAGAALLPDADHHSATISRSVPVLGRLAARTVEAVSGGHRHGAHTLLGAAVVAVGAWALTFATIEVDRFGALAVGVGAGIAALTCFAVKARDLVRSWLTAWITGVVLAIVLVVAVPDGLAWFPLAVVVGFVAHLAGDALTTGGLPGLLWPWVPRPPSFVRSVPLVNRVWLPNGFVALPLLGDTGSWREKAFGAALTLYCTIAAGYEALRLMGVEQGFVNWG